MTKVRYECLELVKTTRKNKFRSQQAFADKAELCLDTVRKFLEGKVISSSNAVKLCELLELKPNEVLEENNPSSTDQFIIFKTRIIRTFEQNVLRTREGIRQTIRNCIQRNIAIPYEYLFLSDDSCNYWMRLCSNSEYRFHPDSCRLLSDNIEAILESICENSNINPNQKSLSLCPNYISFGPGNGEKDKIIIRNILQKNNNDDQEIYYFPFDINPKMIAYAIDKIIHDLPPDLAIRIKTEGICDSFDFISEYVSEYKNKRSVNIFSLLGNTLGNFSNERSLLNAIISSMSNQDFLLLEVRLVTGFPYRQGIVNPEGEIGTRKLFNSEPLSAVGIRVEPNRIGYKPDSNRSMVPKTKTITGFYKGLDSNLENGTDQNELILVHIHYYDIDELSIFLKNDIKLQIIYSYYQNNIGMFLLKK